MKELERRVESLERAVAPTEGVHCVVFGDDPEPTDLPPGSTVHRLVFVEPAGARKDEVPPIAGDAR